MTHTNRHLNFLLRSVPTFSLFTARFGSVLLQCCNEYSCHVTYLKFHHKRAGGRGYQARELISVGIWHFLFADVARQQPLLASFHVVKVVFIVVQFAMPNPHGKRRNITLRNTNKILVQEQNRLRILPLSLPL